MDWRLGGRSSMGWSCADEEGGDDDDDDARGGGGRVAAAMRWKEMDLAEEREKRRRG